MSLLAAVTAEPDAAAQAVRSLVGLAVCGLSAQRGYRRAELVERETGRLPRGWSPTTWSGICFASLVVGHLWLSAAAGKARALPRPVADPLPEAPDPRFSWAPAAEPLPAPVVEPLVEQPAPVHDVLVEEPTPVAVEAYQVHPVHVPRPATLDVLPAAAPGRRRR